MLREGRPQNWRDRSTSSIKHRVSTVGDAAEQEFIEEDGVAEASGFTANCIFTAAVGVARNQSALHQSRKLLAVPGSINGLECAGVLVDYAVPPSR